jgi:UDP-N-acetylmuramoylalanine--D-glutamate ligase
LTELADIRSLAVVGLGASGAAAAVLARRRLGVPVTAIDDKGAEALTGLDELRQAGVELRLGSRAGLPKRFDVLVKSPGVPTQNAAVQVALARGVPVWSEVELACRFLANRIVGITGTNGKTTTTELTGALVRDAGMQCRARGGARARRGRSRHDRRRRALELPAGAHRALPRRRGGVAQPDRGSRRPSR